MASNTSCAIASCNNTQIMTNDKIIVFLKKNQTILFPKLNCSKTHTLFPSPNFFEIFMNKRFTVIKYTKANLKYVSIRSVSNVKRIHLDPKVSHCMPPFKDPNITGPKSVQLVIKSFLSPTYTYHSFKQETFSFQPSIYFSHQAAS